MEIRSTALPEVKVIIPTRFGDARGFFSESWNKALLAKHGITTDFVQDNHSLSVQAGTVRGLHFQTPPHAQTKLVRCGRGSLLDVAVDIRKGAPTYGQWVAEVLSFENGHQLLVPTGFAHGFVTLEAETEIVYKCSDYYAPDCDRALQFDDPAIGIAWGINRAQATISAKDAAAPSLADLDNPFLWEGA